MFICYADESGYTGNRSDPRSPFLVMAGVLVNTYGMHKSQNEFADIVRTVQERAGIDFAELKAKDLYAGRGIWAQSNCGLDGRERQELYRDILIWFRQRRHKVVLSVIDNEAFFRLVDENGIAEELGVPYVAAALHLALMIQRRHKNKKSNKGKTLLIFDQQKEFEKQVSRILAFPPPWTDEYYEWDGEGDRLDQIIDTAYFIRSHHASFVQVADLIAYAVRKYVELKAGEPEKYEGELKKIESWYQEIIYPTLIERRHCLPPGNDPLTMLYRALTPECVR